MQTQKHAVRRTKCDVNGCICCPRGTCAPREAQRRSHMRTLISLTHQGKQSVCTSTKFTMRWHIITCTANTAHTIIFFLFLSSDPLARSRLNDIQHKQLAAHCCLQTHETHMCTSHIIMSWLDTHIIISVLSLSLSLFLSLSHAHIHTHTHMHTPPMKTEYASRVLQVVLDSSEY